MNPSPPARWRLDFNEKRDWRVLEEKKVGGFNQACLFLQSNHRGYHDHDESQKWCTTEEKEMMMMGLVQSQRSSLDLMQNCDLPPPVKVFAGTDRSTTLTTSTKTGKKDEDYELPTGPGSLQSEKLDLLKALQLSQTRAREAEKKAMLLTRERDHLAYAFQQESLQLFAHRHWVRLLELEVCQLGSQRKQWQPQQSRHGCCQSDKKETTLEEKKDGDAGGRTWFMALALCLGIAGVGIAFGCRYLF